MTSLLHPDPAASGATMAYDEMSRELAPDSTVGWNDRSRSTGLIHAPYHFYTYEVQRGRPIAAPLAVSEPPRTWWAPALRAWREP
jgi:hypothetical protein